MIAKTQLDLHANTSLYVNYKCLLAQFMITEPTWEHKQLIAT